MELVAALNSRRFVHPPRLEARPPFQPFEWTFVDGQPLFFHFILEREGLAIAGPLLPPPPRWKRPKKFTVRRSIRARLASPARTDFDLRKATSSCRIQSCVSPYKAKKRKLIKLRENDLCFTALSSRRQHDGRALRSTTHV